MAIGIILTGIMLAQFAGTVIGSMNSANKAGQQQCKIQSQINDYHKILDKVNTMVDDAKKEITQVGQVTSQLKNLNSYIATLRLNQLDEQNDIIADYKKEIQKINIMSLSFIGSIFAILLINFILRLKKPNNC